MLCESLKTIVLDSKELLKFCSKNKISITKLKQCRIEKITHEENDMYLFCLDKGKQLNEQGGIWIDGFGPPDIVLVIRVEKDGSIKIETTDKTIIVLN